MLALSHQRTPAARLPCRDAVYTLHQQPAATCGKGRDARQAGAWVRQETRDWWAWAPSSSSSQRLGWEPVGVPHPTPDIGRSHSFPIHSTHTCCCQLILNPLEGMHAYTHTHTHTHMHTCTPVLEEGIETYGSSRPSLPGSQGQGQGRLCLLGPAKSLSDPYPCSCPPAHSLTATREQESYFPAASPF